MRMRAHTLAYTPTKNNQSVVQARPGNFHENPKNDSSSLADNICMELMRLSLLQYSTHTHDRIVYINTRLHVLCIYLYVCVFPPHPHNICFGSYYKNAPATDADWPNHAFKQTCLNLNPWTIVIVRCRRAGSRLFGVKRVPHDRASDVLNEIVIACRHIPNIRTPSRRFDALVWLAVCCIYIQLCFDELGPRPSFGRVE